jgi:hypothetical protein
MKAKLKKEQLKAIGFIGPRGERTVSHQIRLLTLFLGRKKITKKSKEEAL